jgi:hypothetical protein
MNVAELQFISAMLTRPHAAAAVVPATMKEAPSAANSNALKPMAKILRHFPLRLIQ